jgi:Ferredoxin-fold anticodon binding domain
MRIPIVEALPAPKVSPFPAAFQDVSLVVSVRAPAQAAADAVREGAGELLEDIELLDVFTGSADRRGSHVADIRAAVPRAGSHADRSRRHCGPRCCGTSRSGGGRRCIARLEARAAKAARSGTARTSAGAVAAREVTVGQTLGHTAPVRTTRRVALRPKPGESIRKCCENTGCFFSPLLQLVRVTLSWLPISKVTSRQKESRGPHARVRGLIWLMPN